MVVSQSRGKSSIDIDRMEIGINVTYWYSFDHFTH